MSSAQTSTALTRPYANSLLHILRNANQRYSQLAASIRQSIRPTHHARKRAAALNLRVCIESALCLDYRHVSEVPLAVLESAASPPSAPAPVPMQRRRPAVVVAAPVQILAPIPVCPAAQHAQIVLGAPIEISTKVVGREREITRLSRPAPRCEMPQKSEVVDMLAFNVSVTIEAPESSAYDKSHWSSSESEDSGSEEERSAWYSDHEGAATKNNSGVVAFPTTKSLKAIGNCPRLDVSADVNSRLSWNSDMFSGLRSSSPSPLSTTGPITPVRCLFAVSCGEFRFQILFLLIYREVARICLSS